MKKFKRYSPRLGMCKESDFFILPFSKIKFKMSNNIDCKFKKQSTDRMCNEKNTQIELSELKDKYKIDDFIKSLDFVLESNSVESYLDLKSNLKSVENLDRMLYLKEKYWDFIDNNNISSKQYDFKNFCRYVYVVHNFDLTKFQTDIEEYSKYKSKSTRAGFILFNKDKTQVLLLQNEGVETWSFPKGKCNPKEPPLNCAIRETKEEINYTVKNKIYDKFVKFKCSKFRCKYIFYIGYDISEKTIFKPKINEIQNIKWFNLSDVLKSKCKHFRAVIKTLNSDIVQEFLQIHSSTQQDSVPNTECEDDFITIKTRNRRSKNHDKLHSRSETKDSVRCAKNQSPQNILCTDCYKCKCKN